MTAAIEGILETALYAEDLDAAEAFYGGILGLERITRQKDRHVFFRCGAGVLLIFNPKETVHPPPPEAFPVPVHEGKAALWHLGDLLAWLRDEARYAIAGDLFEVGPPGR